MAGHKYFERVFVVNLDRRTDRWEKFKKTIPLDWPFPAPERFKAVDGREVKPPIWWKAGGPAWGCYRSHIRILEECLHKGFESVLILEDDACFCSNFSQKATSFLMQVPADWEMIYLGGQHLGVNKNPPTRINDWVYEAHNVNRTHAYAIRGKKFIARLYQFLHKWDDWKEKHHIDHHLGRLHQSKEHRIYTPREWLVGQDSGNSDIAGRLVETRYWPAASHTTADNNSGSIVTAVLGIHSSGSSAMAGVLYHLGLHLGNKLGGYYGSNPQQSCGFEARGLARICRDVIPFPTTSIRHERLATVPRLRNWFLARDREARARGMIAAGKHPQLCRLGTYLQDALGKRLRIVHINRPLEESIASIIRRCRRRDPDKLATHQRWLWEGKTTFLNEFPSDSVFTVEYSELLRDPTKIAVDVSEFLGIDPRPEQIERAVAFVQPQKRHIILSRSTRNKRKQTVVQEA